MADTLPRVLVFNEWLMERTRAVAEGAFEVVGPKDDEDRVAWLERHGRGITAAFAIGVDPWDKRVFAALPDLRRIAVMGAGMDGMDLDEIARRGINVTNASAVNADEVADQAVAMMLALRRGIVEGDRWVRENRWIDEGRMPPGRSVIGAKVGIAGLGYIGEAIARRVEPFCPDVAWWGPRDKPGMRWSRRDTLLELAREVDILFVAVRAHDDTRKLVTKEIIEAIGPEGMLVNIARGFVVDEEALIAALKDGRLGQAALDVFDPEPTSGARWQDVPNVLLAPHMAGATVDSIARLVRFSSDEIRAFLGR